MEFKHMFSKFKVKFFYLTDCIEKWMLTFDQENEFKHNDVLHLKSIEWIHLKPIEDFCCIASSLKKQNLSNMNYINNRGSVLKRCVEFVWTNMYNCDINDFSSVLASTQSSIEKGCSEWSVRAQCSLTLAIMNYYIQLYPELEKLWAQDMLFEFSTSKSNVKNVKKHICTEHEGKKYPFVFETHPDDTFAVFVFADKSTMEAEDLFDYDFGIGFDDIDEAISEKKKHKYAVIHQLIPHEFGIQSTCLNSL